MSELMHYGRKGMKWHQHIFGEIDKRAAYASAKLKAASEKQARRREAERSVARDQITASNKKALRGLSDKELRARVERLKLEEEYRKLVLGDPEKKTKGQSIVLDILKSFGTASATKLGAAFGEQKADEYKERRSEKISENKQRKAENKAKAEKFKEEASDVFNATSVGIYTSAQKIKSDIFNGVKKYLGI